MIESNFSGMWSVGIHWQGQILIKLCPPWTRTKRMSKYSIDLLHAFKVKTVRLEKELFGMLKSRRYLYNVQAHIHYTEVAHPRFPTSRLKEPPLEVKQECFWRMWGMWPPSSYPGWPASRTLPPVQQQYKVTWQQCLVTPHNKLGIRNRTQQNISTQLCVQQEDTAATSETIKHNTTHSNATMQQPSVGRDRPSSSYLTQLQCHSSHSLLLV